MTGESRRAAAVAAALDDGLRERVEALAKVEPDCWVFRVPAADGLACTDLIGGRIGAGSGQEFTVDMCCLPCRLRAVLAAQPTAKEGVRTNGHVWAEHGHPNLPCSPPEAVRDVTACRLTAQPTADGESS